MFSIFFMAQQKHLTIAACGTHMAEQGNGKSDCMAFCFFKPITLVRSGDPLWTREHLCYCLLILQATLTPFHEVPLTRPQLTVCAWVSGDH